MRRMTPSAIILLLATAHPAAGAPANPQKVAALLSGFEDIPTEQQMRSTGDDVDVALIAVVEDESYITGVRANAAAALGWFPTERSLRFFRSSLTRTDLPLLVISVLPRSYASAFGTQLGDGITREILPLLSHPNDLVRSTPRPRK